MLRIPLVILLALVLGTPAEAATTVARKGDFTLDARQAGGRLCITLRRSGHFQAARCGPIPRSPQRALSVSPPFGNTYAAAVPRSARFAETEAPDGGRQRRRTVAGRGFAARFVLLPAPPPAKFVRFFGRSGRLLGIDAGPIGYVDFSDDTPVVDGVTAGTETRLAPTPTDPDRLRTLACASLFTDRSGNETCDDGADNALVLLDDCDSPTLAGGVVAAGVAGVRLTLGTGAQVTLGPTAFAGRQVFGGKLPVAEAVRTAEAVDSAGAVIARVAVGTPPGGQPCSIESDDGFSGALVPTAKGAVAAVASADGRPLLAADQEDRLCVAIAKLPAGICPPAPVDSDRPHLLRRGTTVAGVLSGDAARIRLRLDRGAPVTVGTTRGSAYAGRWAGHVRFFAAAVGAGREVVGAVVRNRHGHVIGVSSRGIPRPAIQRRTLAEHGGLGIALVRGEGSPDCVVAFPAADRYCTDPSPGIPIDSVPLPYAATVTVPCSPRGAMAYGRIPDDFAPPRVVLDGATATPRRIRLRGDDAWVAFLPDAPVIGLGAGRYRAPLALPPASAQCGYTISRRVVTP
jgi:hypothetical protein